MITPNQSFPQTYFKPSVLAAVLLWAHELTRNKRVCLNSVKDVLDFTGAKKSQSYLMLKRLKEEALSLENPSGRKNTTASQDTVLKLLIATRDFLIAHPGSVRGKGKRRSYSQSFRHFVLEQLSQIGLGETLTIEQASDVLGVPFGTLKDWLRIPKDQTQAAFKQKSVINNSDNEKNCLKQSSMPTTNPEIAVIINEWDSWEGTFTGFCSYLKNEHRLSYGTTFINSVLKALGLRKPEKRDKKSPPWSRDSFKKLFPGAQWIGDGKTVKFTINEQTFSFNFEAIVDVASNAIVGIDVSGQENSQTVINSNKLARKTTGSPALALTLDNRPSNCCPEVEQAVAPTLVLHSTPKRGQAKAPVEGTFGLFSQTIPPLSVSGDNLYKLSRSILTLIITVWALARNGKPRKKLNGKSPAQFYQDYNPCSEEIKEAYNWILELRKREKKARSTRLRRKDPVRNNILKQTLPLLGIEDPDDRLALSLCSFSSNAILRGLATFRSKLQMNTIPKDADHGPYLGGIIRNLHVRDELERTAFHLLDLRLKHQQLSLVPLLKQASYIQNNFSKEDLPGCFVDHALDSCPMVDFRFFGRLAAKALADLEPNKAKNLYYWLSRRIASSFKTDKMRRCDLISWLSAATASCAQC